MHNTTYLGLEIKIEQTKYKLGKLSYMLSIVNTPGTAWFPVCKPSHFLILCLFVLSEFI